jgi:hypothetical protein
METTKQNGEKKMKNKTTLMTKVLCLDENEENIYANNTAACYLCRKEMEREGWEILELKFEQTECDQCGEEA